MRVSSNWTPLIESKKARWKRAGRAASKDGRAGVMGVSTHGAGAAAAAFEAAKMIGFSAKGEGVGPGGAVGLGGISVVGEDAGNVDAEIAGEAVLEVLIPLIRGVRLSVATSSEEDVDGCI